MLRKHEEAYVMDGSHARTGTRERNNKHGRVEQVRKVAVTPDQATRRPSPPSEYSLAPELSRLTPGWIPSFKDLEGNTGFGGQLANELGRINSGSSRISFRQ